MLEARHLTKYYSAVPAIRDVSFTLAPGTILGLLGPNGSGKSTTVSILTGLREPSAGEVWFNGINVADRLVEQRADQLVRPHPCVEKIDELGQRRLVDRLASCAHAACFTL